MNHPLTTFFQLQFKRHINTPALWLILLIAPVAAKFMVPLQSDSYSVLAVNNAYPVLTPSVIGLKLGIISALLLTPFVYIFLRTARTTRTPWQIEDVTPSRRIAMHLGHWLADTLVLWLFVVGLAMSGVVLSLFRLPMEQINTTQTMLSCLLIACPAFAFIAALRMLFSARPLLRGATGDFLFFVIWMAGIVAAALMVQKDANPILDLYGYAAPIALATQQPIDSLAVGASPATAESFIALDAWRGVTHIDYLKSRGFWLLFSAVIVVLSSVVYRQKTVKPSKKRRLFATPHSIFRPFADKQRTLLTKALAGAPLVLSNTLQIFKPGWLLPLLVLTGSAGLILPWRGVIGPLLWLLVLFPYSHHVARWQENNLPRLLATMPASWLTKHFSLLIALTLPLLLSTLPSAINAVASGNAAYLTDMALIVTGVPIVTLMLGNVTRSSFAVRLPLLMMWYVYFNMS